MSGIRTYPLTDSQRGVYLECMEKPGSTMYNKAFAIILPEGTDTDLFIKSVEKAVSLHPVFGVTVMQEDGVPVMRRGEYAFSVNHTRASTVEEACRNMIRPFDTEKGPLCRFELCTTDEGKVFLFDCHHMITDGGSVRMLVDQILSLYEDRDVPGEEITIFDIAESRKDMRETEAYAEAVRFFEGRFEGVDFDCSIAPDISSTGSRSGQGELIIKAPSGSGRDVINDLADRVGVTRNTVLMGAFAYTLALFAGRDDSCFTIASSGRHEEALKYSMGMFVRTVPMHFEIKRELLISDYLKDIQAVLMESVKHDCVSFADLAKRCGTTTDYSFVYQSDLLSGFKLEGQDVDIRFINAGECSARMICMAFRLPDTYALQLYYDRSLYSEELMESFADTLFTVAEGMSRVKTVGDIEPAGKGRFASLLYARNNSTEMPFDQSSTVASLIDETIARFSERTALVYKQRTCSYREFGRITGNIAGYIRDKKIGPDEYVAVLAPRSDDAVLAAWGVFRSGAACQMLDPTYPAERLNYMIGDSKAGLLIADRALRPVLSGYDGEVLYTDEIRSLTEYECVPIGVRPENAVYIIYTSGTTGTPKGCVLEHRNLVAFYMHHREVVGLDEYSRVASYASLGFDAGVMDMLSALLAGAALYMIPDEIRLDLDSLERFFCDNAITFGFMTTQVGRMFAERTGCRSLKAFMVGGEKLVPFTPQSSFRLLNGYGPCETMAYISSYQVRDNGSLQPIGRPACNTKLYVFDNDGHLLPTGGVGELGIAGLQVGRGYHDLPEKTKAAFISNPYDSKPGYERLYKSGDIVRMLPDGNFEYIGRRDGQVKIRGFRVELTEVEEVIRRYPGVKDATVTTFDEAGGGKYIAAYVTGDDRIDTGLLHEFIRSEKPGYMVPAITVQIPAIPYTQNMKVNRRALPVPERVCNAKDKVMPANETEQKIYDIIAGILGHREFGTGTDIFDAGLTSISALKLDAQLSDAFGKPLQLSDIRQNSTVGKLAKYMALAQASAGYERREEYPLMQNQKGILVEMQKDPGSVRYNIPLLFRLSDKIDITRLHKAVCDAIDAHPYIKAVMIPARGGEVRARRNDAEKPAVDIIEAGMLPPVHELVRPFELNGGRLYRASIYKTGDGSYLFMDMHHIIADGISAAILLNDINAAYAGRKPEPESFTGYEASVEEQRQRASGKYHEAEEYYEKLLAGCNTECLPAACGESDSEETGSFEFDFEGSEDITAYCTGNGISANAFFNAAFAYTLALYLHADDVSYCSVYNGRNDSRLAGCFDMLVKTLPVRCMVDENAETGAFIAAMQKQLISSMSNDTVSFGELASKYGLHSDIFFNYQGDHFNFDTIGTEKAVRMDIIPEGTKALIAAEVFLKDGIYSVQVTYRRDRYCREFFESFMGALEKTALGFLRGRKLGDIEVITQSEQDNYALLNSTETPFEKEAVVRIFERHAGLKADETAVMTADTVLTFRKLNEQANRIASSLIKLGVDTDEIVGLILERSELVPVLELGIMKAGGAFLNMLPSYPDERLDYCMRDAGCRYVITTEDIAGDRRGFLSEDKPYRVLITDRLLAEGDPSDPERTIAMDQLAYCIYTSGSTGNPKGVMIEHHSLSNFLKTSGVSELIRTGSTVLCMASISFDMSISEMILPPCMGLSIYIATEDEIHNPDRLLKAFERGNIDVMLATPSFAWNLISMPEFEHAASKLKGLLLGAEAVQPSLYARLRKLNPGMKILNAYGPTETTQACSGKFLEAKEAITIGKPFANTRYYVFADNGRLLPRYATGELIICGEGVGRGYIKLPEKTGDCFFVIDKVPAYHSGDLVRINRNNEAEFQGRADNQVKLRGFRVELDEVETVMQDFPGITRSKVIVRNNGSEDYLAGFFTAEKTVDIDELTAFMKSRLTYYMVPAAIMQLEKMPLTPSGKLDKKALPEVTVVRRDRSKKAPKKSLEEKILELYKSTLGLEECYVDDNFFEVGGTSLSASKAVMQLKAEGYDIEYQDIFDHQSAEELASYLEGRKNEAVRKNILKEEAAQPASDEGYTKLLKYNCLEYAGEVKTEPLGTVLLTGVTGFLGSHILKTLLDSCQDRIICLLRKGKYDSLETRVKSSMVYYFEDDCAKAFEDRITLVEGSITDEGLCDILGEVHFDTLINCAASVRHYASDDSIEFTNVHGVENLIKLAVRNNARMIQISTTSVPGAHTAETYARELRMKENQLFVIDDMNNQYIKSKYRAELLMFDAIKGGMRGKIIRVGNLMGRHTDGEFQTNAHTNAFLNGLRGFVTIGKCPISHATDTISFSPVDSTARAVVLLAGTNDIFTAFHVQSRSGFDEMKLMEAVNRCGIEVKPVSDEEYYADFYRMMADSGKNDKVSALLTNDRPGMHMVEADNRFTANILYRLGFSWPFIDDEYLEKVIKSLDALDFFHMG